MTKTLRKLRMNFSWQHMNKQVRKFIRACPKCQVNKSKQFVKQPITLTDTPQMPFDKVSIDTIGPLITSSNGNKYALSLMCELSKYLIMVPIPSKDAYTVARAIFRNLILIHGPIKILMSDQGTEFVNSIVRELCKDLSIDHRISTPYHHETLGAIERSHRSFNEYLRNYLSSETDWEECLQYFAFCYNAAFHTSFDHKFTPFELVYARRANLPQYALSGRMDPLYNIENFAKEAKYRLQLTAEAARNLLNKNKIRTKASYDRHAKPLIIQLNDEVMERDEAGHKHSALFKGPFRVVAIDEPNVTMLDEKTRKTRTVHKNNVTIFNR